MTDSCSTCFFGRIAPASAGARFAGFRYCMAARPAAESTNPDPWTWRRVMDDWWCGNGADHNTGTSFSLNINGAVGPQGPKGDTGATGPAGPAGTSAPQWWINATGATGADGDFNITMGGLTVTGLQQKAAGVWITIATGFVPGA